MPTRRFASFTGLLTLLLARGIHAQDDPRIDDQGREQAVWPISPLFDHLHMKLEIDIPSMTDPKLAARETLTLSAIGNPRDHIRLDAVGMEISSVRVGGTERPFDHDGRVLTIHLEPPAEPGVRFDTVIEYTLESNNSSGVGLTWTQGDPDRTSLTAKSPQIHTQGQPQSNSRWFCCHDFPNEKLTSELIVTVDEGYQVCSNGRMVSKGRWLGPREPWMLGSDDRKRTRWHWLQDTPHPNYLVVLVIGKFSVVDVGGSESARPGLPMPVYVPVGSADRAIETFADTPAMVAFFEDYFDEPYPWHKYAQLVVRNFAAGGMENTSATTLFGSVVGMGEGAADIIAHELAHQWTGDLVTCEGWAHIWLNEGWASFAEALWSEHHAGAEEARRAYQRKMYGFFSQEARNPTRAPENPPLVSNRYGDPFEPFMRPNNPYPKGAMVLHMLRLRLGDEIFQRGARLWIERYKHRHADTDDFRKVMEEVSGQDLERFFDQWCFRPGSPRVSFGLEWSEDARTLTITARQEQDIDADNPAYALTFPILCTFADGRTRYVYLSTDQRELTQSYTLPEKPADVVVDPNLTVLARTDIDKPLAMWIRQLETGPTLFAQLTAADALAASLDPDALRVLADAALDPETDESVRARASGAIAMAWLRTADAQGRALARTKD